MTHWGPYYADGTPMKVGDRVKLLHWSGTDDFEVRSYTPLDEAIIANVTPGFKALGTSTVPIDRLSFLRRADGAA